MQRTLHAEEVQSRAAGLPTNVVPPTPGQEWSRFVLPAVPFGTDRDVGPSAAEHGSNASSAERKRNARWYASSRGGIHGRKAPSFDPPAALRYPFGTERDAAGVGPGSRPPSQATPGLMRSPWPPDDGGMFPTAGVPSKRLGALKCHQFAAPLCPTQRPPPFATTSSRERESPRPPASRPLQLQPQGAGVASERINELHTVLPSVRHRASHRAAWSRGSEVQSAGTFARVFGQERALENFSVPATPLRMDTDSRQQSLAPSPR